MVGESSIEVLNNCLKFKKHEVKSQLHKSSIVKMENFLKVMALEQPSVADSMNSITTSQINAFILMCSYCTLLSLLYMYLSQENKLFYSN